MALAHSSFSGCIILLLLSLALCQGEALEYGSSSAYDHLVSHHLPPGLLPDNVLNYTLQENGQFTLTLENKCSIVYPVPDDEVLVHYDKHITGTLKNLSISDLTGVSTKEFFWLTVTLIHKEKIDDDVVYFNAGYLYRSFPESVFATPKSCNEKIQVDENPTRVT